MAEELIILRGGPKDGWVYDLAFVGNKPKIDSLVSSVEYRATESHERRSDGALMTVYTYVGPTQQVEE